MENENMKDSFRFYICPNCGHSWKTFDLQSDECMSCGSLKLSKKYIPVLNQLKFDELINKWYLIGLNNQWIAGAYDPSFTLDSFRNAECDSVHNLWKAIRGDCELGNYKMWSLGTVFYWRNICCINQLCGGDEWLIIRDDIPFESCTFSRFSYESFKNFFKDVFAATNEQLRKLEYSSCRHLNRRMII